MPKQASNYEYQHLNPGGSWVAGQTWTVSGTGTAYLRVRRVCTGNGCNPSPWATVSWNVVSDPTEPTLTRVPNADYVCDGALVSATTLGGSGGVGCTDYYQYNFDGGSWLTYTPGANLNTAGRGTVTIRAWRNCSGVK